MSNNTDQSVVILAADMRYASAPCFVAPYFDMQGQCFIVDGKEYPAETVNPAKGNAFYVSKAGPIRLTAGHDSDQFKLEHNMTLNKKNERDVFLLSIILDSGMVAKNKQEVNPEKHRFYLSDPEEESRTTSTFADQVFSALSMLQSLSATDRRGLAYYLKQPVRMMTDQQIEGYLKDVGTKQPKKIIEALGVDKRQYKVKVFIQQLVQCGVYTIKGGQYYFGDALVGISEDETVSHLLRKDSAEQVRQLQNLLKNKREDSDIFFTVNTEPVKVPVAVGEGENPN